MQRNRKMYPVINIQFPASEKTDYDSRLEADIIELSEGDRGKPEKKTAARVSLKIRRRERRTYLWTTSYMPVLVLWEKANRSA